MQLKGLPDRPPEAGPARRRLRPRCALLALLAALLLAGYLGRQQVLPALASFLDVSEPPRRVSAVMVLGGGAEDRPFVAAALVRDGLADRVLVPTFRPAPEIAGIQVPSEHELIRLVLLREGVPADRVIPLPGECASTQDEAGALLAYLDREPQATVAVVTHAYHTRRARLLFRRALGAASDRVSFVAAPSEAFSADDWWQSEEGFVACAVEYAKLGLYLLR